MPTPYELDLTAAQIKTALNNAFDSGNPPTSGSGKLVNSDQIYSFVTTYVPTYVSDFNVPFSNLADVIDDDTMATATDTTLATSKSIKAYVDASSISGFSPSSYNGGESVTLPNGLIMKFGSSSVIQQSTKNITFETAFTSAISAQVTILNNSSTYPYYALRVGSLSSSGLSVINTNNQPGGTSFYWMVIGR